MADSRSSLSAGSATAPCVARRVVLAGRVQGLGVRPAVFHLAEQLHLAGTVRNTSQGVVIEIEGAEPEVTAFIEKLPGELPSSAVVTRFTCEECAANGATEFTIVKDPVDGPLATRVPEERVVCDECLAETNTPGDRREDYPFTSCTACGPRYTVIRAMPFEREDTVMEDFPLCPACLVEYRRPRDRRFHAQTMSCPVCGPQVWCRVAGESAIHRTGEAMAAVIGLLRASKIVAVRGLGGYQLLVDATNQEAVARLRLRKHRVAKPLAVMVGSLAVAERLAVLSEEERAALSDPAAPIVLVTARAGQGLAAGIHPGIDTVGLMLPTTPLHAILARDFGKPLVCTSGNREGEPLEYEVDAAEERLADIADAWLHHNREITRPIDDSVVRVIAGRRVTLRLARGLAPLPLDLGPLPPTLAVGGFLKSAVAWSNGAQCVLGPHIGDQETLAARERFAAHLQDWEELYRFQPERLVHDLHPDYFSTRWAQSQQLPTVPVQHHHAHVLAAMLEQGWLDRPVLGVAWDGTGYGTDGTVWGGEFLLCDGEEFERVAALRSFRLPGGEAAIREPWRAAVAICQQLDDLAPEHLASLWNMPAEQITKLAAVVEMPKHSPLTTSAGRLFDAVAALALGVTRVDFDGQAAMQLEAAADRSATGSYRLPVHDGVVQELDWRPLVKQVFHDVQRGVDPGAIAMQFHRGLAQAIVRTCRPFRLPVALSGGVFQNRLLTELVAELWDDPEEPLGLPGLIPPNDGGLAAGQLAAIAVQGHSESCA